MSSSCSHVHGGSVCRAVGIWVTGRGPFQCAPLHLVLSATRPLSRAQAARALHLHRRTLRPLARSGNNSSAPAATGGSSLSCN
eukprot:scaffold9009_cov130-Isochrysis_galbana.AAC.3